MPGSPSCAPGTVTTITCTCASRARRDSPECKSQAAQPPGDGCDQLDWWFNEKAKQDRAEGLAKYHDKVASMPALPEQCAALLK